MTSGKPRLPGNSAAAFFGESGQHLQALPDLGYSFHDAALLRQALTHPSLVKKANNQRLEFLGDAVLQLCISHILYHNNKEAEGKLTRRRQQLVKEAALAEVARSIDLGNSLLLIRDFRLSGGAELDSVLADAMEAVLGAIYLDGGLEAAMQVVGNLWEDQIRRAHADLDPKGALQAMLAAEGNEEPLYQLLSTEGPPHQSLFTIGLFIKGVQVSSGKGRSKQKAQVQAARRALEILRKSGKNMNDDKQGEADR